MTISLDNIGKRYNYEWIFRHVNYTFSRSNYYAITGPNGSGKSTLLQIISGSLSHSEGNLIYQNNKAIPNDNIFRYCSMSTPYLELIEEFTLAESFHFYKKFKPFLTQITIQEIIRLIGLEKTTGKQIRYFSSGMKQRVKLAQAIFADVPILLLDEPCTNLDEEGIALYHHLIKKYTQDRIVIISSNDRQEYNFCNSEIKISDYK